jgi:hypothetical protein
MAETEPKTINESLLVLCYHRRRSSQMEAYMRTTYLVGVFVPKGHRDGEQVLFEHYIPVKVTVLQKEMLVSSPPDRSPFVAQAREVLRSVAPDLVDRYRKSHNFLIVDPNEKFGQGLRNFVKQLEQGEYISDIELDLTDTRVLSKQ